MESKVKKKLIVIKPNGNHSNRLLQNSHFEVFCKEHNIEYHNPTFNDMAGFYTKPCNVSTNYFLKFLQIDLLGKIFRHSRVVKRIFSVVWIISKLSSLKLIRFDKESEMEIAENLLLKAFEKNNLVYVAGWKFRMPQLTEKYKNEMQMKYSLNASYYENNLLVKKTEELKAQGFTLIGLHVRRGDYKTWKGGIYCYEDTIYEKYIDSFTDQLLNQGKRKPYFLLFSNEKVDFKHTNNILISNEAWYIDHHLMSICDYLIGPPSTFTLWASYLGNAKLLYIKNSNDNLIL